MTEPDPGRHLGGNPIRAAGTKAPTRDRVAKVSQWAWPFIWGYAQHQKEKLFPAFSRDDTMSRWHSETLTRLELPHLPLHNARHHWAVTHLRAGVPLELVRRQLGHSTPVLTLKTYGAFIPTGEDRAKWEAMVHADTERRRQSKPETFSALHGAFTLAAKWYVS